MAVPDILVQQIGGLTLDEQKRELTLEEKLSELSLQAKGKRQWVPTQGSFDNVLFCTRSPKEGDERPTRVPVEIDDTVNRLRLPVELKRPRRVNSFTFPFDEDDKPRSVRRYSAENDVFHSPSENQDPSALLGSNPENKIFSELLKTLASKHQPQKEMPPDSGIGSRTPSPISSITGSNGEARSPFESEVDEQVPIEALFPTLELPGSSACVSLSDPNSPCSPPVDSRVFPTSVGTSSGQQLKNSIQSKPNRGNLQMNPPSERTKAAHAASVVARLKKEQLWMTNDMGDNLLHRSIKVKDEYLFSAFLYRCDREGVTQAIIDVRNKENLTPLHLATVMNLPKFVELLVKRNANVNSCFCLSCEVSNNNNSNPPYYNAVHYAAGKGDMWLATTLELLKSSLVDFRFQDSEGNSPLHCAIAAHGVRIGDIVVNSTRTVEKLLMHGAPVLLPNVRKSMNALHLAIERNNCHLVKVILETVSNAFPLQPDKNELINSTTALGQAPLDLVSNLNCSNEDRMNLMMTLMEHSTTTSSLLPPGFDLDELLVN